MNATLSIRYSHAAIYRTGMSVPICDCKLDCGPGHHSDHAIRYLQLDQACGSGAHN